MTIGRKFRVTQTGALLENGKREKTVGRVVWVHPERRFCILEFAGGVRECFSPFELGVS